MVCIYCTRDIPEIGFKSREHVVPKAFGTFSPDNLTLRSLVCDECNHFFGNSIDLILARGSIEAMDRLAYGIKPSDEAKDLRQERIQFTYAQAGPWKGIKLELKADSRSKNGLIVEPLPQIRFAKKSGDSFIYIPLKLLEDEHAPLPDGIDLKKCFLLIVNSNETKSRIIRALKSRNIDYFEKESTSLPFQPGKELLVNLETVVDIPIRRCIAKIGLNYLAYVQIKATNIERARTFILKNDFSRIRDFIRNGIDASYPLVIVDSRPILADDFKTLRRTSGHIVTVDWTSDKCSVFSQISLFNRLRYRVCLARDFTGVFQPICSGHLFDIKNKTTKKLVGTSLLSPRIAN
jgi:hypothetical protein